MFDKDNKSNLKLPYIGIFIKPNFLCRATLLFTPVFIPGRHISLAYIFLKNNYLNTVVYKFVNTKFCVL